MTRRPELHPAAGQNNTVRKRPMWAEFVDERTAFGDGTRIFDFSSEAWYADDAVLAGTSPSKARISFRGLPVWLRQGARLWIATLWLKQNRKIGVLSQVCCALKLLGKALPNYIGQPGSLGAKEARRVREHLAELYRNGHLSAHSVHDRRKRIVAFVRWARTETPQRTTDNFRLKVPIGVPRRRDIERPLEQRTEKFIPTEVLQQLLDACAEDESDYFRMVDAGSPSVESLRVDQLARPPHALKIALQRAIYAQAIKLAACVGRRAISICLLPLTVRTEKSTVEGHPGVWIRFVETKIRGLEEDVFCPYLWGEIALDAIEKTQVLTTALRSASTPEISRRLFIVPRNRRQRPVGVVFSQELNHYLLGRSHGRQAGLLARRCVMRDGKIAKITTHNFRTTLATKLAVGGIAAHDLGQYLGHGANSPDMALNHYVVGMPEVQAQFERALSIGAVSGDVIELARQRPVAIDRISPQILEIYRKRGLVLNLGIYGACALPAEGGICITANPCWQGPNPEHPRCRNDGCGCPFAVLAPHAIPALEADETILEAQIAAHSLDARYANWLSHSQTKLALLRVQLQRAREQATRLNAFSDDTESEKQPKAEA